MSNSTGAIQTNRSELFRAFHFLWRERPNLFNNPVILREVVSHLRSPSTLWQLCVFLLASSIAICIFWAVALEQMQGNLAINYTREMFKALNLFFVSFVLLLVPLQSASAINLEKERDSWDLLISTNISLGSIILGKLVSSLAFIWLIAISLLPMYAILIPLGGIAPKEILFVFLMMTEASLLVAVLGLTCSIYCKRVISSILAAYIIGVTFFLGSLVFALYLKYELQIHEISAWVMALNPVYPYIFFFEGRNPYGGTDFASAHPYIAHAIMYSLMIVVMLLLSFWRLAQRDGVLTWEDKINNWIDRREKKQNEKRYSAKAPPMRLLPDHKNPVTAKEGRAIHGRHRVRSWMTMAALFFFPILVIPLFRKEYEYFYFVFCLAPILVPLMVLPYACNAVRGERDRRTWDLLITTAVTIDQLLWGKLQAGWMQLNTRAWSYLVFPTCIIVWMAWLGDMPRYFEIDTVFWVILTCFGVGIFYLMLGLYLSSVCRKTLTAYAIGFGAVILTYFVFPLIIAILHMTVFRDMSHSWYIFWAAMVSPWLASFKYIDPPDRDKGMLIIVFFLQIGFFITASSFLYHVTKQRMAKISERRDEG